jgi:hypothetical protein
MSLVYQEVNEREQRSNSGEWEIVATRSADLTDGTYRVDFYCELAGHNTEEYVAARLVLDGTERGIISFIPDVRNHYKPFSCFGIIEVTGHPVVGETHVITLQYRSQSPSQTAKIRRKRFTVMKF